MALHAIFLLLKLIPVRQFVFLVLEFIVFILALVEISLNLTHHSIVIFILLLQIVLLNIIIVEWAFGLVLAESHRLGCQLLLRAGHS